LAIINLFQKAKINGENHPLKLKNIGLVVLIVVLCDLAFAQILKHSTDFWTATYPVMDHRIRSEKLHHVLVKNREIAERWG
jgi:hypothetical protein